MSAYLVARKTNDCQALAPILLVQGLKILVLRSQTYEENTMRQR